MSRANFYFFFLSCEGAGVMCSLTICLSSPTKGKRDRKPELAVPPHVSYVVSLVLIPNGNGKPEVTLSSPAPRAAGPHPAVFVNNGKREIHNGKRQRDPELLVWRRMLVVNEDSSYFIPTGNGNGVRCAVYLYEFW